MARDIAAFRDDFSDDFVVFNIFFEEFNPEEGGESWNFQRALGADGTIESLGEEDEGVCVVKEIQQLVFDESIQEVKLSRSRFVCKFDPEGMKITGAEGLEIDFDISDELWAELSRMARLVFIDRDYFKIV